MAKRRLHAFVLDGLQRLYIFEGQNIGGTRKELGSVDPNGAIAPAQVGYPQGGLGVHFRQGASCRPDPESSIDPGHFTKYGNSPGITTPPRQQATQRSDPGSGYFTTRCQTASSPCVLSGLYPFCHSICVDRKSTRLNSSH